MTAIPIPQKVQELMASMMPRQARYRYYPGPRGEMYCWNTERLSNGKFACWDYMPYGEGSRSGKPTKWHTRNKVEFTKRKLAKQRAYDRYLKAEDEAFEDRR